MEDTSVSPILDTESDVSKCGSVSTSKSNSPDIASWSPSLVNVNQKWSPQSLHDRSRKSAFQPYRQCTTSTVLTNLQRGNTQTETLLPQPTELTYHMKAAQGELTEEEILTKNNIDHLDQNKLTALHWSCAYGQYNSAELLIKHGADVNKVGPDEESPLILAANGGHHEIVRLLINSHADVNHVDHLCNTALMYAARGNHTHACQELLSNGANFSAVNLNNDTAHIIAVENNSTADCY
ncbi:ankyrin repeat family A protein 2-like isoform X2 [Cylas formicarius]|uniref:ankyrin repeat family A protein 2-like isoform X2 n=1 Tax=Cylas formicarius TaxID=197179 RepID=UPI002958D2D4|nr:ankyrin repeat family A protein 2-like isoform X2 [Cylas formicarius]